jgi:hypothetical protein
MDDPVSYPQTQQALTQNPAAGAALLARLCALPDGPRRTGIAIEWLEPVLDRILPPFNAVLGDAPEQVHSAALDQLNQDGTQLTVRYLLQAAFSRRRLAFVLPGLATWLTWEVIQRSPVDRRFWSDVAMELTPASAEEAAWLDAVLLATGNDLRSLFAGKYPTQQFGVCLDGVWRELVTRLPDQGPQADRMLTGNLIGFLGRYRWRSDQAQTAAVMELAGRLTAGGARPELRAVVDDPIEALRQLSRRATPAQIAQACVRAYAERFAPGQVAQALAQSQPFASADHAADVLDQLHWALFADQSENSYMWQRDFTMMLLDGRFGEQIAVELPPLLAWRASYEIGYHLSLVNLVATSPREGPRPALTDARIDYLHKLRDYFDDILRNAGKRQRKGMFRKAAAGAAGEGGAE